MSSCALWKGGLGDRPPTFELVETAAACVALPLPTTRQYLLPACKLSLPRTRHLHRGQPRAAGRSDGGGQSAADRGFSHGSGGSGGWSSEDKVSALGSSRGSVLPLCLGPDLFFHTQSDWRRARPNSLFRLNHLREDPVSQMLGVRASTCGRRTQIGPQQRGFPVCTCPEPRTVEAR